MLNAAFTAGGGNQRELPCQRDCLGVDRQSARLALPGGAWFQRPGLGIFAGVRIAFDTANGAMNCEEGE
jgi:hypothetical protein